MQGTTGMFAACTEGSTVAESDLIGFLEVVFLIISFESLLMLGGISSCIQPNELCFLILIWESANIIK